MADGGYPFRKVLDRPFLDTRYSLLVKAVASGDPPLHDVRVDL